MKIKSVFKFPNGNIAVCDEYGKQIPELQDESEETLKKIGVLIDKDTKLFGITKKDLS